MPTPRMADAAVVFRNVAEASLIFFAETDAGAGDDARCLLDNVAAVEARWGAASVPCFAISEVAIVLSGDVCSVAQECKDETGGSIRLQKSCTVCKQDVAWCTRNEWWEVQAPRNK